MSPKLKTLTTLTFALFVFTVWLLFMLVSREAEFKSELLELSAKTVDCERYSYGPRSTGERKQITVHGSSGEKTSFTKLGECEDLISMIQGNMVSVYGYRPLLGDEEGLVPYEIRINNEVFIEGEESRSHMFLMSLLFLFLALAYTYETWSKEKPNHGKESA